MRQNISLALQLPSTSSQQPSTQLHTPERNNIMALHTQEIQRNNVIKFWPEMTYVQYQEKGHNIDLPPSLVSGRCRIFEQHVFQYPLTCLTKCFR